MSITEVAATPCRVDALLTELQADVRRLTPHQVVQAVAAGALLVDTRTETQRADHGELPGAVVIDRTVLEWRLDPTSPWRIPEADDPLRTIIIACAQGYSSTIAAASLRSLGLPNATDMTGGVEGWVAEGLPMHTGPVDIRR